MPRLIPVSWKVFECVLLAAGFKLSRHKGSSHRVYEKEGVLRSIVVPTYDTLGLDIITSNLRSAGISREEYFRYLADCL